MTDKQKVDFGHWLINNMQFTSVSNVELIIDHVDRYFCHSPSGVNVLVERLESLLRSWKEDIDFKKQAEEKAKNRQNVGAENMWRHKREGIEKAVRELSKSLAQYNAVEPEKEYNEGEVYILINKAIMWFKDCKDERETLIDWWEKNKHQSQPGSLQGEQESINFLEWVGKEGWKWSELNSRWFKLGSDDYLNETQLHEKFKERDVTEEHKSDREPERELWWEAIALLDDSMDVEKDAIGKLTSKYHITRK